MFTIYCVHPRLKLLSLRETDSQLTGMQVTLIFKSITTFFEDESNCWSSGALINKLSSKSIGGSSYVRHICPINVESILLTFSVGRKSSIGTSSSTLIRERWSATPFYTPLLSLISMSNSWSSRIHRKSLGFASFFWIKYFNAAWSMWTTTFEPTRYCRKFLNAKTTAYNYFFVFA